MYEIDQESINKLLELNNSLNKLEVRGAPNIEMMYNCMLLLKQVIEKINEIEENKKKEKGGIN
jgi:methylthioribose-1-phosphate isomerase